MGWRLTHPELVKVIAWKTFAPDFLLGLLKGNRVLGKGVGFSVFVFVFVNHHYFFREAKACRALSRAFAWSTTGLG
jgi:hypothetical protein